MAEGEDPSVKVGRPAHGSMSQGVVNVTVNSEKIALVNFLRFLVFSLGRKIIVRNYWCCHFKCIAGTPSCG